MYSVYQHWDRLKTMIVGKSYPPEFYSYITNPRVRNVMERIAIETEEDYQKVITILKSFNVEVLRPDIKDSIEYYKLKEGRYMPPPMTPRDWGAMIGNTFYYAHGKLALPYNNIIKHIKNIGNKTNIQVPVSASDTTRIGKDLYFGTKYNQSLFDLDFCNSRIAEFEPSYRCHFVNTGGHSDGCFNPVVPGLIISLNDIQVYEETFPNWEVVYLPDQTWTAVKDWDKLKEKNQGKWWVSGEELNNEFTEFVEHWMNHWVGYVEESVFDVNMFTIDEKNVVCNNYNKDVFDAFERFGITPHIINFRHRFFWDGGLHCITQDLDREGKLIDWFPQRG
jgi:hypothetical protein